MSRRYISLDIDGVVNDYPAQMYNYARKYLSITPQSKEGLMAELFAKSIDYKDFKLEYRRIFECIEGAHSNSIITSDFWKFYRELESEGSYNIIFRTTRPVHIYPNQLNFTHMWLTSMGIMCEAVVPKDQDSFRRYNPVLHIDDEIAHLENHLRYTVKERLVLYSKIYGAADQSDFKEINKLTELWEILGCRS